MKTLKTLLVVFSLICVTLHSKPSQAGIGLVAGSAVAVSSGLTMAAIGGAGTLVMLPAATQGGGLNPVAILALIPMALLGIGLLILEGEQQFEFAPLEAQHARKLGVTSEEMRAFNNEIDQINALASYVDSEISRDGKPTKERAAEVWTEIRGEISPEAFDGLVKVNNQLWKQK